MIRAALVASLAALALVSCGSDDAADASAEPSLRLAVIPKGMTHEFWKTVQAGAEARGAELGVEVVWDGPAKESDRSEQIKIVEKNQGRVDGIAIAPLDAEALVKPLRAVHDVGKPVVVFDSGLAGWDEYVSFIATDNLSTELRVTYVDLDNRQTPVAGLDNFGDLTLAFDLVDLNF